MTKTFDIEKLSGADNYHDWCFAVQNVIEHKGLLKCIKDPVEEKNAEKLSQCKTLLALSVEKRIFVHIRQCQSALEIWQTLKKLFEDDGMTRSTTLLQTLIGTKLEDCESMHLYVDKIIDLSSKLDSIGFEVNDKWKKAILLAGLSDYYKPFIMGLDASDSQINFDKVASKLIDQAGQGTSSGEAFFSKKKFNKKNNNNNFNKKKKCETCGKKHGGECNKKIAKENEGKAHFGFHAFVAESNKIDWYIDSGASAHMTSNENILSYKQKSTIKEIIAASGDKMPVNSVGKAVLN